MIKQLIYLEYMCFYTLHHYIYDNKLRITNVIKKTQAPKWDLSPLRNTENRPSLDISNSHAIKKMAEQKYKR